MLNEPLPSQIDVRKLVVKNAEINATFSPSTLPRFATSLANDEGVVTAELHFYSDESHKKRLDGHVKAQVSVPCQRCLEPVSISVDSNFQLAIVWTDEQAAHLPKSLDPLIVGEELTSLSEVVEEELILSLPIVSYHDEGGCVELAASSFGEPVQAEAATAEKAASKENPFKVLEQLKSGDK